MIPSENIFFLAMIAWKKNFQGIILAFITVIINAWNFPLMIFYYNGDTTNEQTKDVKQSYRT